jgi:DNA-directed RNA polymerase specialized sigma24 family protein
LDPWVQDAALARPCLAGDEAAWRELVDCHGPRVYSICLARGLRPSEAEDVCQEVMLSALRSLRRYGGCRLSTWLNRITQRRIADHLRSRRRRDLALGFPGDPGFPDPGSNIHPGAAERRRLDCPTRATLGDELRE